MLFACEAFSDDRRFNYWNVVFKRDAELFCGFIRAVVSNADFVASFGCLMYIFYAMQKYFFRPGLQRAACNLCSHLCVSSTRLLSRSATNNMLSTCIRGEREESKERKTGKESEDEGRRETGRENPLPQITRLGLLFIVGNFCFHREGASDRRSKDDLCAGRSRIHTVDQWGGAHRVSIVRRS